MAASTSWRATACGDRQGWQALGKNQDLAPVGNQLDCWLRQVEGFVRQLEVAGCAHAGAFAEQHQSPEVPAVNAAACITCFRELEPARQVAAARRRAAAARDQAESRAAENTEFQSFFMLTIVQPFARATSSDFSAPAV